MVRQRLFDKMTLEKRAKEGEEGRHLDIKEKSNLGSENSKDNWPET